MANYGFYVTIKGLEVIASLLTGETLTISRIMVGSGKLPDSDNPMEMIELIQPIAQATSTIPLVKENVASFIIEYRNDMNGGLDNDFYLSEFGIYAYDKDGKEVLIYYATLGEYAQPVPAYIDNRIISIRYPVAITIMRGTIVALAYPAGAFMTAENIAEYVNVILMPLLTAELAYMIKIHNEDPASHPYHLGLLSGIEGRVKRLEDMFASNVKDNAFGFSFGSEADRAKLTFTGVLNMTLGQLEW